MAIFSPCFKAGIERFLEERGLAELDPAIKRAFVETVCQATEDAIREAAANPDLLKSASEGALTSFIRKRANEDWLQKRAVIRQEDCVDSKGNPGKWVLYDSSGKKRLGCHPTREAAEAQERAIQVSKRGEAEILEQIDRIAKKADMESGGAPKGREGRAALAKRFMRNGEFSHTACVEAMRDEEGITDPHAFCRALEGLAHGGHRYEATRGSREGKVKGSSKQADMYGSPIGREGRIALAKRFYHDGEFHHTECVEAIRDEGFTDDPHAFCRALASLVGREREATRGPREGKVPGEA